MRATALTGAAVATAATALIGAAPAQAADHGTAAATTAKLGLDVKLLGGTADVPVDVSLNALRAPASSDTALLTATVSGVQGGASTLLQAAVDKTDAVVDAHGARSSVHLVDATVHVPGLPLLGIIALHELTSRADCPVDGAPSAEAQVLGDVMVLGERASLRADGETKVAVPAVGTVALSLSERRTESAGAAATALELKVTVDPLKLNVAQVTGDIVLGETSCSTDGGAPGDGTGSAPTGTPSTGPGTAASTGASTGTSPVAQPASATTPAANLAQTGGGSAVPLVAGVGAALLAGGAGAVYVVRRRKV